MISPFSPRVTMKRMRPFFGKVKGTADGEALSNELAGSAGAGSMAGGSTAAGSSKVGAGETAMAVVSVDKFDSVVPATGGAASTRGCGLAR